MPAHCASVAFRLEALRSSTSVQNKRNKNKNKSREGSKPDYRLRHLKGEICLPHLRENIYNFNRFSIYERRQMKEAKHQQCLTGEEHRDFNFKLRGGGLLRDHKTPFANLRTT
ncbi:hypothetical protein CEXT_454311 [Caerostris extrusa]|uniref:Uncharacterized protein n=1 Tax=Caerostris extrusa TaxID=172846 RepID=A0AAV4QM63_CAEEX|nr:hypothetical protein CEXT_454311 [Caerostris extrusa]